MARSRHLAILGLATVLCAPGWLAAQSGRSTPATRPLRAGVPGTEAQLRDGWLSADAVVVGVYAGPDTNLGSDYHVLQADEVWLGSPAPGRLVFKAPRGVRGEPGSTVMLLLWDRLGGAPDSYLEQSKGRWGADVWLHIGPDSLASYLLPFPTYAYPFEKNDLVLRGGSAFPTRISRRDLKQKLQDYMWTLLPQNLYKSAEVVVRARVREARVAARRNEDVVVDYRVEVDLEVLETLKGQAPRPLQLAFTSFPRSPRFQAQEEVILFLARGEAGLWLAHGKRSVYHVQQGEVLETGRPVSEFVKQLRGA